MDDNVKQKINKSFVLLCLLIFIFLINITAAYAIKPVVAPSTGYLLLKAENIMGRTYTGFYSVVCGVATWYYKYSFQIICYCWYYKDTDYYATLPGYGYTLVTAEKLARCIWNDSALGLGWTSSEVVNKITDAILWDKNSTSYPVSSTFQWDPYPIWKWRSVYMETMIAHSTDDNVHANCWGTADYMTRSWEWSDAYPSEKAHAQSVPIYPDWGTKFPFIYLDGWQLNNTYSIDADLANNVYRFHLTKWATAASNPHIHLYINSFDIIRLSANPKTPVDSYELVWDGINLGTIVHATAYLCTDTNLKHWFFEKANYGATSAAPYRINAFGIGTVWDYEQMYRSTFRHDYDFRRNMATDYEIDWANVE